MSTTIGGIMSTAIGGMRIIDERGEIRKWISECAKHLSHYKRQYGSDYSDRSTQVWEQSVGLDPDTTTAEAISTILGRKWDALIRCDECKRTVAFVVEVGEHPQDYETATARLCLECLKDALALATQYKEESAQYIEQPTQHKEESTQHMEGENAHAASA